jgi:hypothetical protein
MGRNVLVGVALAACLAVVPSNVSLFGIEAWKIVLALIGFAIFAAGSRSAR